MEYIYTREIVSGYYNIHHPDEKSKIDEEILSNISGKTINSIVCDGASIKIAISPDLDANEKILLDTIIQDHKDSIPNNLKYPYKITGDSLDPTKYNINIFGLFREDIFDDMGALVTKNYYKNYDGTTYSDLVVKDEYAYTYTPPYNLVNYRDETITWYLEDDAIGSVKIIRKYYTPKNAIIEANTRRENLIDKAQAYGMANITGYDPILQISEGQKFFLAIKTQLENYRVGVKMQELLDTVQAYAESAVTQQMKDDLCDIFDYWS